MGAIDTDFFVGRLSEDSAAGADLEYDQAFYELEEAAKGTPDKVIRVKDPENPNQEMDRVIPGEVPDAKAVLDLAKSLFGRTRDLRIAVHMTSALTRLNGLPGLAEGLSVVAGMLENLWDDVHPQLQADDDFDPFIRINVLNALSDVEHFIKVVRACHFVESRAVGRFTLRDIEVEKGELAPLEGQSAPSLELFRAALQESDHEVTSDRQSAVAGALQCISRIGEVFGAHNAAGPELGELTTILTRAQEALWLADEPDGGAGGDVASGVTDDATDSGSLGSGSGAGGRLANRADARRQLEGVAEFLERTEPANPAPIFIRRAIALLDMSFLEIIRNMTPEALAAVRNLGGLPNDGE